MGKSKILIAIGVCVALLLFPLSGMADTPLPNSGDDDGHPWDDGNQDDDSSNPADDPDNPEMEVTMANADEAVCQSASPVWYFASWLLTGNWFLLLLW